MSTWAAQADRQADRGADTAQICWQPRYHARLSGLGKNQHLKTSGSWTRGKGGRQLTVVLAEVRALGLAVHAPHGNHLFVRCRVALRREQRRTQAAAAVVWRMPMAKQGRHSCARLCCCHAGVCQTASTHLPLHCRLAIIASRGDEQEILALCSLTAGARKAGRTAGSALGQANMCTFTRQYAEGNAILGEHTLVDVSIQSRTCSSCPPLKQFPIPHGQAAART